MSDYTGYPGGLSESETLARLTVEQKRRVAKPVILEFPHLDHATLDGWLADRGVDASGVPAGASLEEKTDALLDQCETLVRSGEDPEALDRFVYGYLSPANLESLGVDPGTVADRDPLDVWDGVYDG